jgi:hypothetical protein
MAFLTMRLWRQPVAAGGKEIRLVEAVSGLETIEPFAPPCPLVFPQPFHPFRHSAGPRFAAPTTSALEKLAIALALTPSLLLLHTERRLASRRPPSSKGVET